MIPTNANPSGRPWPRQSRAQAAAAAILGLLFALADLVVVVSLLLATVAAAFGLVWFALWGELLPMYESGAMRVFEFLGVSIALLWLNVLNTKVRP